MAHPLGADPPPRTALHDLVVGAMLSAVLATDRAVAITGEDPLAAADHAITDYCARNSRTG